MSEFGFRFETLKNEFLEKGYDLLSAMQLAIAQIQHEVGSSSSKNFVILKLIKRS